MACTDTYMHAITWSNEANRSKPEHRHTVSVVCVCSLLWTFRYIQRVFFCFFFASASTHALRHSRWLLVVLACLTNDRHNHWSPGQCIFMWLVPRTEWTTRRRAVCISSTVWTSSACCTYAQFLSPFVHFVDVYCVCVQSLVDCSSF